MRDVYTVPGLTHLEKSDAITCKITQCPLLFFHKCQMNSLSDPGGYQGLTRTYWGMLICLYCSTVSQGGHLV